jgi:hypothetical protein
MNDGKLIMRLESGDHEVYLPEADAYLNVSETGLVTVKKASGQECYACKLWDIEERKIERYRTARPMIERMLRIIYPGGGRK